MNFYFLVCTSTFSRLANKNACSHKRPQSAGLVHCSNGLQKSEKKKTDSRRGLPYLGLLVVSPLNRAIYTRTLCGTIYVSRGFAVPFVVPV